jgi:hypothetical protein
MGKSRDAVMITFNKKRRQKLKTPHFLVLSFSIAGLSLFCSGAAKAGFEWVPAPKVEKKQMAPAVTPMPAGKVDVSPIATEKNSGQAPEIKAEPLHTDSAPSAMSTMGHMNYEKDQGKTYKEAMGFGRDIPLALAMRQIVPADYAYSFDSDVDPAMRIDWNGGKPWNEVLSEALFPHGLGVHIVGHTVWVRLGVGPVPKQTSRVMPNAGPPALETTSVEPVLGQGWQTGSSSAGSPHMSSAGSPHMSAHKEVGERLAGGYDISQEKNYNPSYPRRNPIPLMMKSETASGAPQSLNNYEPAAYNEPVDVARSSSQYDAVPAIHSATGGEYKASASTQMPQKETKTLDPYEIRFWEAKQGESLRFTLMAWSEEANTELFWDSNADYVLPANVKMHGTYPDAIKTVLMLYEQVVPRPIGRLHPNLPAGPSVLTVETYSN